MHLGLVSPGGGDSSAQGQPLALEGWLLTFQSELFPGEASGWPQVAPEGAVGSGSGRWSGRWALKRLCSWNVWELPVQPLTGQGEEVGKGCPTVTAAPQLPRQEEAAFRRGGTLCPGLTPPALRGQ